ncbi:hypothetical protein KVT40_007125 [Elsinoe batatas]|uniref:Uncharacterized protein n=1 Tax=Elsinoe batatas TaxID=2601811 RepID=A0A8K0KZ03_9PEZI|nr:hypothetical protein KVT40_007125 [Elsinoe batatas]
MAEGPVASINTLHASNSGTSTVTPPAKIVSTQASQHMKVNKVMQAFSSALEDQKQLAIEEKISSAYVQPLNERPVNEAIAEFLARGRRYADAFTKYNEICVGCLLTIYKVQQVRGSSKKDRHTWRATAEVANQVMKRTVSQLSQTALVIHRVLAIDQRISKAIARLNQDARLEVARRMACHLLQSSIDHPWWMRRPHFNVYGYMSAAMQLDVAQLCGLPQSLSFPMCSGQRVKIRYLTQVSF